MAKLKHHPAAFINNLAEEGTKDDAIIILQKTWNDLMNLHAALSGLGFTKPMIQKMQRDANLGKVF